jgi:hypothetical protein
MASASASVVLTGKVRKTKIARDGTAVVVKKTLGDGTTLEERFPKRRATGKRKDTAQMIPVEDVIRGMEEYAKTIEPEVKRRVEGVHQLASKLIDQEAAKEKQKSKATLKLANRMVSEEKKRTHFQKGRAAAARTAAGNYQRQAKRAREQARQALSFVESIARHVNDEAPAPRRRFRPHDPSRQSIAIPDE